MPAEANTAESNQDGAWLTIGSFDGVHIGHQQIIKTLVRGAATEKASSLVVTFYPHPVKVLKDIQAPFYLTTPEEKDRELSGLGITSILTIRFNRDLANLSAYDFMKILHDRLKFSCLLIGYDFHLGKNREGDITELTAIGENLGYCVRAIEPLESGSQAVSSSRVRKLIMEGQLGEANKMLGRWYELSGEVVHGDGRGRHIGIPTANISCWSEKLIPATGIYSSWAQLDDRLIPSVVNIGLRPTFYENPTLQTIEVHLLDFNRDIYGSNMRLHFVNRIRYEEKFDSAETLMKQIRADINKSREVLANAPAKKNLSP